MAIIRGFALAAAVSSSSPPLPWRRSSPLSPPCSLLRCDACFSGVDLC
ncbi:hypothetical protein IHE45_04G150800 [Dioscorea alata]|uniref:Uncharacterized protein n=1 Tax=Dioscorea alata TaxID=55571 RepID=A0ACB7WHI0_DIOAL|nr:hypothetical protein IHE45_04G150800 [Dioscorea alata]